VALGAIAGPFNAAYCLRDVGLSYFQLGLLNAAGTVAALLGAPFWGKMADRYGCRPIMILGLAVMAPCGLIWLAVPPGAAHRALWLLPWTNFIAGFAGSGFWVALGTMIYKITRPEGRAVQFALYGIFVTLVSAPMPLLGGWLVSALAQAGWRVDLRLTFYLWMLFTVAAALLARRLHEPGAVSTRTLAFECVPDHMNGWLGDRLPFLFGGPASAGEDGRRLRRRRPPPPA